MVDVCKITLGDNRGVHFCIDVYVEGQLCNMLLDSGASKSVLDNGFAEYLELEKEKDEIVEGAVGNIRSAIVKVNEIHIGRVSVENMEINCIDLSQLNATYSSMGIQKVHGIIGADILEKTRAIVNFGSLNIDFDL